MRLHRPRLRLSYFDDVPQVIGSMLVALGLVVPLGVAFHTGLPLERMTVLALTAYLLLAEVLRSLVFAFARWVRLRFNRGDRTLVFGAGPLGIALLSTMSEHPEFGLRPVGFVDPRVQGEAEKLPAPIFEPDLATAIVAQRIGTVVLAFGGLSETATVDAAITAHQLGCTVLVVPRMFELYRDGPDVERLRMYPLLRLANDPTRRSSWLIKRVMDILLALAGLLVLAPLLVAVAVATLVESGRPVLFVQERVGFRGRSFHLYKFRSLTPKSVEEQATTWSIAGDARVGPVGRLIRRTSLDELPQLWNILCGTMSVVGPRPERPAFVRQFSAEYERYFARHRVPAGLTGLAQVNGLRGDTSIAERARYDNYYIANWSLWLDLKIIFQTIRTVVRRGSH
jgi:exopolysaccharide biosynthesis polyprenyl glycosylphosphotransferase